MLPSDEFSPGPFEHVDTALSNSLFRIATAAVTRSLSATVMASPPPISTMTLTSSSATSSMISTPTSSSKDSQGSGECELLGPFAILVQGALGLLALGSLVFKRWRERPQRPLKIWAFDASKQVFGSVLLHLANLVMSMFSAGQIQTSLAAAAAKATGAQATAKYQPNPCSFYLLNLGIDTTLGIPILIVILRVLTAGASLTTLANPPESIQSGNYGTPPRATWWLKQSLIYFMGLLGMKSCVFFIFEIFPWIARVGDWALGWTEGNAAVQIAFVMLIFPLIMNGLQYYIIDSFIKNNKPAADPAGEGEGGGEHGALLANDENLDYEEASKDDDAAAALAAGPDPAELAKLSSSFEDDPHSARGEASGSGSQSVTEEER